VVAYILPQPVAATAFPDVVAELEGSTNSPVMPASGGFIVRQLYGEGTFVKKGDVLFELDPRLTHSSADLTPGHIVPTAIRSPADGVAERAVVGPGDLVTPQLALTRVATIDPIKARFNLPLDHETGSGGKEQVEIVNPDGAETGAKADLVLDRPADGTSAKLASAYALFANPGHKLLPGQYVKIRDLPPLGANAFRIPATCVSTSNGGGEIFVIGSGDRIESRHVTVGSRSSDACLISEGLQPGDRVVLDDAMSFKDGETVTPQMALSH
jgi:RND family efflux transporter MFP subunit